MDFSTNLSVRLCRSPFFISKPQPLLQPAPFQVSDAVNMRLQENAPPAEYPDTVTSSRLAKRLGKGPSAAGSAAYPSVAIDPRVRSALN